MKKEVVAGLAIFVLCLFLPSIALSDNPRPSAEDYLQELRSQGKERVIVVFEDEAEVDPSLVEKYGGTLIRTFTTIKALVCELPQENIELLKQEPAVKDAVPDVLMQAESGDRKRDPEELAEFLRLKKEYLKSIRREYLAAVHEARQEYRESIREHFRTRRTIMFYTRIIRYYRRTGKTHSPIYKYLLLRYTELLKEYYAVFREAWQEYRNKITQARNVYGQAQSEWRVKVDEMMALSYEGPVTVRWNNLEAGLNSKAAWDNYDLDGTGIKIAFLDSGINYTLENLDDNYLGGHDYVDDPEDDDPMPLLDQTEDHGTQVASLAVGEGVNKVVGVAYNASYYSVRIVYPDTGFFWWSDLTSAIEWASTEPHKADIISMSVSGYDIWGILKEELENVCNNAYNDGIILVAGSGNEAYTYSGWPAAFDNVISVGAHSLDQTVASFSNGEVDVVAPSGDNLDDPPEDWVYTVGADNSAWWFCGTSASTPHASALIALQLQYARLQNIETNNGYNWEVMKHSAIDLGLDPVYQGKGKIWAAEIAPPPPESDLGSVDLMSSSMWPFDYSFEYLNYIYLTPDGYPAYYIGTSMYQDIILTNLTNILGNTPETIENLNVTTTHKYCDTGEILPGDAIEDFEIYEPITLDTTAPNDTITLEDTYYIPWATSPGLYDVVLDLEFNLQGNSRVLKITDNEASIWCPPGPPPDQTGYGAAQ